MTIDDGSCDDDDSAVIKPKKKRETFPARPQTPSPSAAAVPNMPGTFPGRPRAVSVP
ncbi:hypothetical protein Hanom_Chr09g00860571 [Helianthus anomalus]